MSSGDYYTASQIASAAGLSKQRVLQLLRAGDIPEAEKRTGLFGQSYWVVPSETARQWASNYKKKSD